MLPSSISLFILLIIPISRANQSASYTSITALDKYGSVPQIRNAATASNLHGSLTLVAVANRVTPSTLSMESTSHIESPPFEEAILVISLERKIPGRFYPPSSNQPIALPQKQEGKINVLAYEDHLGYSKSIAIIGSGFKSDLVFLLNLLRRYSCNYWERYDIFPDGHHMALAVSQVMLRFMGYDDMANRNQDLVLGQREYATDTTLFASLPHVLRDLEQGGDDLVTIGRPLGLRVFVTELKPSPLGIVQAHVRIVEPSGIISQPILAHALGRGNEEANKLLRDRYKWGMSVQQVQDTCVDLMKEVILGYSSVERPFADHMLVCEVLHKDGIETRRIPLESLSS